jgi:hypothetical protein
MLFVRLGTRLGRAPEKHLWAMLEQLETSRYLALYRAELARREALDA